MAINPSLLIVPYRYKAAKLYSQLPESGDGDFAVTRGTTATRVNASGLIESVASGVPRLDYTGGGCPSLLVEPAATNLVLRSEEFDTTWTTTSATITANQSTAPDGLVSGDLFVPASGSAGRVELITGTAATNTTVYSGSIYFKKPTLAISNITFYLSDGSTGVGNHRFGVQVNLTTFAATSFTFGNGVTTDVSVTAVGNDWYRARFTGNVSSGAAGNWTFACRALTADGTVDGTNGLFIWGAQAETGSVATSYIPTVASTVTRNADVISLSSVSGLIGQTEGTIYAEGNIRNLGGVRPVFAISDGSNDNRIVINSLIESGNTILGIATNFAGSSTVTLNNPTSVLGNFKVAFAYIGTQIVIYVNGVATSPVTTTGFGSFSIVGIGTNAVNSAQLNDRISAAAVYTSRLSDSQLIALTTL